MPQTNPTPPPGEYAELVERLRAESLLVQGFNRNIVAARTMDEAAAAIQFLTQAPTVDQAEVVAKLRSEVFAALRRHEVSEQCFAEVAMITQAAIDGRAPFEAVPPVEGLRDAVLEEAARACRLYPDWCANWGLDRNMGVAIEAANECATMLERLPTDLPDDNEAAAILIHRTTDEWKRMQWPAALKDHPK